jgi:demethylmenaquinone methyltransferase/2-methoxy-6-polyprenyl-1,4-benzoquinol methylase
MDRPLKESAKIEQMFSSIASHYDFLNRLLSLGRDRYWRSFAVKQLPPIKEGVFLDVATGTGDVALEIARRFPQEVRIIGIDISDRMIELGREKVRKAGYLNRIELRGGDVNNLLPFQDNAFDASLVAFGIRNVQDHEHAIKEMVRVIKKGGYVVILEFTSLKHPLTRPYRYYVTKLLPVIGEVLSGRRGAYRYLPDSMKDFPDPETLRVIMQNAGLRDVRYYTLTFGITAVHVGIKK